MSRTRRPDSPAPMTHEPAFREVLSLIERARQRAFHSVNTELIDLYWRVGEFISQKLETAVWGQGVVAELAAHIQQHLMILGRCKRPEKREFYIRLSLREGWKSRDLDRQLKASLFARAVLSPPKVAAALRQTHPEALDIFKDSYLIEFLQLPVAHSEADLHGGLLARLKEFLIELGRDFCFVGSEYPLQIGGRDFSLDMLFFNRALHCPPSSVH